MNWFEIIEKDFAADWGFCKPLQTVNQINVKPSISRGEGVMKTSSGLTKEQAFMISRAKSKTFSLCDAHRRQKN